MTHGPHTPSCRHVRDRQRGVALIIVLGFLGLMVMMAVAFMVQARVERMVADSTLEGMRARQIAQTGIAAAVQDYLIEYMEAVRDRDNPGRRSDPKFTMFRSGVRKIDSEFLSSIQYGKTDLWDGEAGDWLPKFIKDDRTIDIDDIDGMRWIWVRQDPLADRTRILGRYAYVCFNLSGGVDANLLGRDFGQEPPANGYGAQTNRDNVRKMVLSSVQESPSSDRNLQLKLAQYQNMWQGFDTPAALEKLTDGIPKDGTDTAKKDNRWGYYSMDEASVRVGGAAGLTSAQKKYLSCYSYAATHSEGMQFFDKDSAMAAAQKLTTDMGGDWAQVRQSLEDYFSNSKTPNGTRYPSVKAVPMFNEIKAEVQLVSGKEAGKWQLKVTIKPEFWAPFPSQDDNPSGSYTLEAPTIGGGEATAGDKEIWIRVRGGTESGDKISPTLQQASVEPAQLSFSFSPSGEDMVKKPKSPGEFVYLLDIVMPPNSDGSTPSIKQLGIYDFSFQKEWALTLDGKAVDTTPSDTFTMMRTIALTVGGDAQVRYREVKDPRLNHLEEMWEMPRPDGTMGDDNNCLAAAKNEARGKMGYEPGKYMYCRNGDMLTPAELGYIPIYTGTPWMTLDIFSDNGIKTLNQFVCNEDAWSIMGDYEVFYTNGTINPYSRNASVLAGAFLGIDVREVPNMEGDPDANAEVIGAARAEEIAKELVKDTTPDNKAFDKAGPFGWARVLRYKGFNFNKNERISLAHNTWGLFNESDSLVLAFVVAQSISEAPAKVDPVGVWNEKEDMVTGERWAVALCWMDSSKEGPSNREMDIIMFKYLNE